MEPKEEPTENEEPTQAPEQEQKQQKVEETEEKKPEKPAAAPGDIRTQFFPFSRLSSLHSAAESIDRARNRAQIRCDVRFQRESAGGGVWV